jgi:hypothetical protein
MKRSLVTSYRLRLRKSSEEMLAILRQRLGNIQDKSCKLPQPNKLDHQIAISEVARGFGVNALAGFILLA